MTRLSALDPLEILIGSWSMAASLDDDHGDAPRATTTFEWLSGRQFLIQRWQVDHPGAPDGIALIGRDGETGRLLQHYFDSRGVSRIYEMMFADGVWRLWRAAKPPDFAQRFTANLDDDGNRIVGTWEISHDGVTWAHDFDLVYTRARPAFRNAIGEEGDAHALQDP